MNLPDEYCLYEFYGQNGDYLNDSSLYDILNGTIWDLCDDIDIILTNYCGNKALFQEIEPNYNESIDTDHSCVFYLENEQTISKTYNLPSHSSLNEIIYTIKEQNINLENGTEIELTQSFLSLSGFEGIITIENIAFTAVNGSEFSFIDIASDNTQLNVNINQCEFYDINAINGSIVNILNNNVANDYLKPIIISIELSASTHSVILSIMYSQYRTIHIHFRFALFLQLFQ